MNRFVSWQRQRARSRRDRGCLQIGRESGHREMVVGQVRRVCLAANSWKPVQREKKRDLFTRKEHRGTERIEDEAENITVARRVCVCLQSDAAGDRQVTSGKAQRAVCTTDWLLHTVTYTDSSALAAPAHSMSEVSAALVRGSKGTLRTDDQIRVHTVAHTHTMRTELLTDY